MRVQRLIKETCKIVSEDVGEVKAAQIARSAQNRYEALRAENSSDSKELRSHSYKRIYPGIAVYEAMRSEGISQEKAVWYIREYFQRLAAKRVPFFQRAIKTFGLARKFPHLFMAGVKKSCQPNAGFVYELPESHDNEARINIVRCPYFEICKRYGCPEITSAYCDSDDAGYGNLHPNLIWGRTKTIGHGGDCCDFLLEYKKK
ncbi:L-2-amino-thiazoline-4-carboxylic acid hydrolase [Lancefieldella rimae]|uniref:L-2-amino-thiazoline-4-carboxylic acid hydrolase n=1 Tax=Lancefieldella rimae TaxID=1383 RepID=UPI001CB0A0A1|nr:L-2-amino-thiazoline-4-carboxylic acid hydrolase [Lancefieldella rimae]MBF4804458.1 L-2-amino-thiazoline-4-carboxylic acid hydrolase [Lancefieldella rimae]